MYPGDATVERLRPLSQNEAGLSALYAYIEQAAADYEAEFVELAKLYTLSNGTNTAAAAAASVAHGGMKAMNDLKDALDRLKI